MAFVLPVHGLCTLSTCALYSKYNVHVLMAFQRVEISILV